MPSNPGPRMPLYGYARVSTIEQDLSLQQAALKLAGCDVIRAEKASGARRDGRTELQMLLDFLRPSDALVVTRIDRLARSMKDLQDIVHELKAKGVDLRATEQPIDTGTAAGKAFLERWASSPSSRPISGVSVRWRALQQPSCVAFTPAVRCGSTRPRSGRCTPSRSSARPPSPTSSASAGLACTGY